MITEITSRQLTFTEILKISNMLFKRKLRDMMTIFGILLLPVFVATFLIIPVIVKYLPDDFADNPNIQITSLFIVLVIIFAFIMSFIMTTAYNACIKLFDESFHGRDIDIKSAILIGINKFWPTFWALLLMGLIAIPAYLCIIIPAIIWFTYTCLTNITVVLKNLNGIEAIKYSIKLIKGHAWLAFRIILFIGCIQFIIQISGELLSQKMPTTGLLMDSSEIITIIFGLLSSFVTMYNLTTLYVFYINREMMQNNNNQDIVIEPTVNEANTSESIE